jgi:RES domain-containing protein
MIIYRITLAVYAGELVASGTPGRWNSRHVEVIYTANSRALACLENVVHRNALGLQANFRVVIIEVPHTLVVKAIESKDLIKDWHLFDNILYTQAVGDKWIESKETAILKVPSVIVPGEHNYLLHPLHPDFKKIKLLRTEPFVFDARIKDV